MNLDPAPNTFYSNEHRQSVTKQKIMRHKLPHDILWIKFALYN
jgi:hypothetical protein